MIPTLRHLGLAALLTTLLSAPLSAQTTIPEKGGEKAVDPALLPIEDDPHLPRVLIIGDSISIGYTIPVRNLLAGRANVHRIPQNGSSTVVGNEKVPLWIGQGKWDVIIFNWGLHDLKYMKDRRLNVEGTRVSPLPDYETRLRAIIAKLRATGAKLLWVSTTPVPEGSPGRVKGDEVIYNAAAGKIMEEEKIPVIDLHAAALAKAGIQLPNNVHFTPEGYQYFGEIVAKAIGESLPAGN